MKSLLAISLALGSLATTSPAIAAYVVDTGTPTNPIVSAVLGRSQGIGGYFTLASDTVVTSVEGFIFGPSPRGITINIHRDGLLPDDSAILFSSTFTPASVSTGPGQWQGLTGKNWNLAAGSYWVSFITTGSYSMRYGAPNPLARYAGINDSTWGRADGLAVGVRIGAAVPESATWAMMLLGFGTVGGALRMRRRVTFSNRIAQ